jgi:hypothetical protein
MALSRRALQTTSSATMDNIEIQNIGGTSYRAAGCGHDAVYDCTASAADRGSTSDYACVPENH